MSPLAGEGAEGEGQPAHHQHETMIDLHTHILHEFDDGAESLSDALVMARAAVANGITTVATTPHGRGVPPPNSRYSVALIRERFAVLQTALEAEAIPLTLVAGTEIYGEAGALAALQAGRLLTYGTSRALLLEFPLEVRAEAAAELIFGFQLANYRVVVAHPERYRFVRQDPNALIPLIERGALMQLTSGALIGRQGSHMQRVTKQMLQHGMAHILATDSHGPHLRRMPDLAEAHAVACELVGAEVADALVLHTPAAILADAALDLPPPEHIRRWFGLW
ncbi:MAG: capsular biosynthesis protein [Candidatus Viridilinea halotolerans]|uniref:protein-tyrosine-phosphatase n=1 Tax=Candidatus Viridilinea halotolerans TaxID=2491704 RepID=A0A426U8V2_9CHLR|nr:MAG: capsular biosynthesis protein [Candidatus Viridilinea halotolerans]